MSSAQPRQKCFALDGTTLRWTRWSPRAFHECRISGACSPASVRPWNSFASGSAARSPATRYAG
eukprot:3754340-Pleurochrysis_carterae.AAC.1